MLLLIFKNIAYSRMVEPATTQDKKF